jgi:hypothetical protein
LQFKANTPAARRRSADRGGADRISQGVRVLR